MVLIQELKLQGIQYSPPVGHGRKIKLVLVSMYEPPQLPLER